MCEHLTIGFLKRSAKFVVGMNATDRIGDRIVAEIEQRALRGEAGFWVQYTQDEVGVRTSTTNAAPRVRRRIEKAGHVVLDGDGDDGFGAPARFKIAPAKG